MGRTAQVGCVVYFALVRQPPGAWSAVDRRVSSSRQCSIRAEQFSRFGGDQ
jgi:hypothetical protein